MAPRALLCVAIVALILGNPAKARITGKRLIEISEKAIETISMTDTVLAIKARTNSIRAYNHMKQGEKEEAQMSMYRAMFGLAVVNGAGGLVVQNPMTITFVNHMKKKSEFKAVTAAWNKYNNVIKDDIYRGLITQDEFLTKTTKLKQQTIDKLKTVVQGLPETDEVVKTLRRASKWAKVVKYIDFLGPWFDGISLVLDSWDLYDAIKENNTPGIVSSSLGIASSVVGLATLGAVALGVVTGGVGLLALGALSVCLGLAGTLVEIAYQEPCCNLNAHIHPLVQLQEAGIDELVHSKNYLLSFPKVYRCHELYESNPAVMQVREGVPLRDDPLEMTRGLYTGLPKGTYIQERHYTGTAVFNGYVLLTESFTGRGAMVVLDTKLVRDSQYKLRGAIIKTYRDLRAKDSDFVTIGDFWDLAVREKLIVKTGNGNDTIYINGPIGQPTRDFGEDTLDVDTCDRFPFPETLNTLSFSNLEKGRPYSIKGAYYSARTAHVGLWYFPGNLHKFGKIKPINLVIGSSFDDVFEMSGAAFYVEQTEGVNKYIITVTAVTTAYYEFYEIVDSSEIYRLSGQQPELVVCSYERITINNFEWTDEQILNFKVNVGGKDVRRSIRFQFLTEPKVSIYYSGSNDCVDNLKNAPKKTFNMTLAKQVDISNNNYIGDFNFNNVLHGYGGDDTIRFLKPEVASLVQTPPVYMGSGNDTVILTEELMKTVMDSGAAMELKEEDGKDWLLIRQGNPMPDYWFGFNYKVELQDVEMIANENKKVLVDLRKPVEGTVDLKARYEMAMLNDWFL
ncbi:uncharacterized protein LOC116601190 [Nematostella vectensis]|uniref:uncharacterized protein LOC116601190 n=1 Tax=Nematostella vectensis TaxID=45351 RepID=UPI00139061D5|nr:uncharacterized protein LOC116601190 [Nematostella vectensis]